MMLTTIPTNFRYHGAAFFSSRQIIRWLIKWNRKSYPRYFCIAHAIFNRMPVRTCSFALVRFGLVRFGFDAALLFHISINTSMTEPRMFAVPFNALFVWDRFLFIRIDFEISYFVWEDIQSALSSNMYPLTCSVLQPILIHSVLSNLPILVVTT